MNVNLQWIKLLTALLLLPLLGLAKASPANIEVKTKGLVCPACGIGIKKWLKKNTSVKDVKLDTKAGITFIYLKGNKNIADKAIRAAISKAGYESGEIKRNKTGEE